MRTRFVLLLMLMCAAGSAAATNLEEFDARLETELRAIDPALLTPWRAANAAREAERHADAIRLYGEVFARAPRFVHALRRQAGEELAAGDRAKALEHGRQAVAIEESAENLSFLASTLVDGPKDPSPAELQEAKELAMRAARMNANDPYEQSVAAHVAIMADDMEMLRAASERLDVIDAGSPGTHVFHFIRASAEGEWSDARAALDRASAAGLPDAAYDSLLGQMNDRMPFYVRWWKPVVIALAVWIGVFALLLGIAAILSRAALRAAREIPHDGVTVAGLSGGVRRAYAAVLSLCCVIYYASIPIVLLLVVGLAAALLYATFALGHIPVKLVILIVVAAGVSVWSMLKSLFIRTKDVAPGTLLDLTTEPRLRALLDDVAQRIGTRAVDNVYLTPGTDVAVMERGKGKAKERCLILGLAALDGFALRPFKAVLGHEYGHFTNRDTAGGAFALAVRNSLHATAIGIIEGGVAAWYNPAWLFVRGFDRVFLRISQGASRLQEVLADRWAVFAYGAAAFENGLRHVVARSVRFDEHVGVTLKEVVDAKVPLANLYTYAPATPGEDLTAAIDEALQRKGSPYDSHPTPEERFALVRTLPDRSGPEADDDAPAWSLFADPPELQRAMTATVRENVLANYGVAIAAPEPA